MKELLNGFCLLRLSFSSYYLTSFSYFISLTRICFIFVRLFYCLFVWQIWPMRLICNILIYFFWALWINERLGFKSFYLSIRPIRIICHFFAIRFYSIFEAKLLWQDLLLWSCETFLYFFFYIFCPPKKTIIVYHCK